MALGATVTAAVGLAVSVASADSTTRPRAAAPASVSIDAAVAADGTPAPGTRTNGPQDGWAARKVGSGAYELSFSSDVDLAIRSWEQPAGVTVRPLTHRSWAVSFTADDVPVDTAFTFEAAPLGP
jgi:hypothetical protein